jgi:hypothetical protein
LTPEQLRDRAREYRAMAATASDVIIGEALIRLADRFDQRASAKEAESEPPSSSGMSD